MRRALANERGKTVYEALLVAMLVGIFMFVGISRYISGVKAVREVALRAELLNLRNAVNLYVMLNKKLPASLKVLLKEKAVIPKSNIEGRDYTIMLIGNFVESMTVDDDGYPLDPFHNRYSYNPTTGRVKTSTKGYEAW